MSVLNTNWGREKIKKLIELVELRECLWNIQSADYHNKNKRRSAIEEMSIELQMSEHDIKKKLHTLRAQYSKERSKMKNIKSGSSSHQTYQTKWEFFDSMQFMFRHSCNIETVDSITGTSSSDINHEIVEAVEVIENYDESTSQSSSSPPIPTTSGSSTQTRKRRRNESALDKEEQLIIGLQKCLSALSHHKEKDDFAIFGDFVASELRQLTKVPDLQLKLKTAIQEAITKINFEHGQRLCYVQSVENSQVTGLNVTDSTQEPTIYVVQNKDDDNDEILS